MGIRQLPLKFDRRYRLLSMKRTLSEINEMNGKLKWHDFLDEEKITHDGEFNLYRNYADPDGTTFLFSRDHNTSLKDKCLFNEQPIAKGITAYFACDIMNWQCLYNLLKYNIHY